MTAQPRTSAHARRTRPARRLAHAAGRGFTLIETALTTVIIGVGVLALIEAQQTFMRSNDWSTHAATATYLANEVRELMHGLPRHDPVTGLYTRVQGNTTVTVGWGVEAGENSIMDFDDLDDFDGLTLGFDGTAGVSDGDLPGPVDSFGEIIPEINAAGMTRQQGGVDLPLQGWWQVIHVDKVDPFNNSTVRAHGYSLPAADPFEGLAVDHFPVRVTVEVKYRGQFDTETRTMAVVSWIVPGSSP